jgi:NAD(P)-dependent dehydrogenase (short-subunit alcohol dehydrogenase family)
MLTKKCRDELQAANIYLRVIHSKVALISGANKGIGLETARQLASLGYTVILGARKEADGLAAAATIGPSAHFVLLDMTNPKTFHAAAAWLDEKFGKLDVLVNNAGIGPDNGKKPSDAPIALIRDTFETNVFGLVELTQVMLPLLRKSEAGRIVNVSSILGSLNLNSDFNAQLGDWRSFGYNGSKAAVNMFTATLAFELKDTAIKVNAAHPGWVKTDLGGEGATLEVSDGAKTSVRLATLDASGPTGGFFHLNDPLPW